MKKVSSIRFCVLALVLAGLACNLPTARKQVSTEEINRSVASTVAVEFGSGATAPVEATPRPVVATPSDTPLPTETPTIPPTPTSTIPIARVLQNTNCRSGPGTVYDLIYIAMAGDEAEIIARSSVPNYTVIEVPDGTGRECWLWMEYSEQEGSTDDLPQRTPPPTPTPVPSPTPALSFTLTFDDLIPCFSKEAVYVHVQNTGALALESHSFTAKDVDTSETVTYQSNGFPASSTCPTIGIPTIAPGNAAYLIINFTPPIAGHTIKLNAKICGGDGLAEPCVTKSMSIVIPMLSDANSKENFESVDRREILDRLVALPITSWNYIGSDREDRHIGPMAQDFNPLFGVGEYEDAISSIDSSGVALAAIQALDERSDEQTKRIAALEEQYDRLIDQIETDEVPARAASGEVWPILLPLVALAGLGAGWILGRRSKR